MSEISALPANIVDWLKSREELKYIRFLTEYPAIKKAVPLKYTTAAVGIESMEIVDSFEENDEGVLVENEYCRQAKIRLRLSIHAPFSQGGEACHDAFTDIIDCLTFASGLDIITSGCNGVVSDRDTDAFVLSAWAMVNASLCPASGSSLDFPSFINKELLCGSHINNSEVHLSATEKQFLGQPFVTGTYFGTGAASRSISLGFEPSVVIVTASGYPLIYANHAADMNYSYSGIGLRNGSSMGVEVTKSGFKIFESDDAVKGTVPRTNEGGTTFFYMAFR